MSKTLETVAWSNPFRRDFCTADEKRHRLTWPDARPLAEACSQALCDKSAAEAIIAGLEAENAQLRNSGLDRIIALEAERDALKADLAAYMGIANAEAGEAEALRKNAARYLWLRAQPVEAVQEGGLFVGLVPNNIVINGDDLDHMVDGHMAIDYVLSPEFAAIEAGGKQG